MSGPPCLTRIVATVGPASAEPAVLESLLDAGVSVFRLNFSHGEISAQLSTLRAIRGVEEKTGRLVATLADLPGPKIRVAPLQPPWTVGGIELAAGTTVRIAPGAVSHGGPDPCLGCTYTGIVDDADVGHRVLIDDGAVRLLVVERDRSASGGSLVCTTVTPGVVRSGKGINLPDSDIRADPITKRDRDALEAAVAGGIDYLGMSFVQDPDDLHRLRSLATEAAGRAGRTAPPIVAKIERPRAVERIEAIVDAADGVMVARGDLGVEMDMARVPILQKRLLAAAASAGKPSIVATQMLQSMIEQPTPTRAEASDVANAILDGCDAVMLSGETAIGKYPVLAVEAMARIAREAEAYMVDAPLGEPPAVLVRERNRAAAIAHGASRAARDLGASAVIAWSETGTTARLLSRYRFSVPIHAVSTEVAALRRTCLLRGVVPLRLDRVPSSFVEFAATAEERLVAAGAVTKGETCLVVTGERFGRGGSLAAMAVREIGVREGATGGGW